MKAVHKYRYLVIAKCDKDSKLINLYRKYSNIQDIIDDCGEILNIKNRHTIWRIENGFMKTKKFANVRIMRIDEPIKQQNC